MYGCAQTHTHTHTHTHTQIQKANTGAETKQKFFHRSNSMGVRFVIHELLRTRNALIELISSLRRKMLLCFDCVSAML